MDAERAADLEAFKAWKGYELPVLNNHGQFHQDWLHREFVAFCAGRRRTAPVSAPIVEELPPHAGMIDFVDEFGKLSHKRGYTVEQVEQIVATYAERIRHLERELAERANSSNFSSSCGQCPRDTSYGPATCGKCMEVAERKTASIGDDPKFRTLAEKYCSSVAFTRDERYAALIAYIDGRTAGTAPELYTCIGKGGEYEHIGIAAGAGVTRGNLVHVYRDRANGNLFYRTPMDFDARMERIAAAPTPKNSEKEEA
jgi:hypothetical protein